MDTMKNDKLLTVYEAAALLGVSPATIRRAIDKGKLAGFRIPGSKHRRISRAAVEEIVAKAESSTAKG